MLWLARDFSKVKDGGGLDKGVYAIFCREPKMKDDIWSEFIDGGLEFPARDAPIELKPGEGPVRVKLVKA